MQDPNLPEGLPSEPRSSSFCAECGARVTSDSSFCGGCGTPVATFGTSAASSAETPEPSPSPATTEPVEPHSATQPENPSEEPSSEAISSEAISSEKISPVPPPPTKLRRSSPLSQMSRWQRVLLVAAVASLVAGWATGILPGSYTSLLTYPSAASKLKLDHGFRWAEVDTDRAGMRAVGVKLSKDLDLVMTSTSKEYVVTVVQTEARDLDPAIGLSAIREVTVGSDPSTVSLSVEDGKFVWIAYDHGSALPTSSPDILISVRAPEAPDGLFEDGER